MKFPAAEIFLIIRQFLEQPEQFSFRLLEPAMAAIQELLVVVFEEGDQEAVHGLLVLELFLAPAVLLDLLIEGLNQVGGVEAPPDCGREVVEGEQVVILQDGLGYLRVAGPPLRCERITCFLGCFLRIGLVERLEVVTDFLPVGHTHLTGDVPGDVHAAVLVGSLRENLMDRVRHPLQAIGHEQEDILHAAGHEVLQNLIPDDRGLVGGDGIRQDLLCAIRADADRDVNRLLGDGFPLQRDVGGVQVDGDIAVMEGAFLEGGHLLGEDFRHVGQGLGRVVVPIHLLDQVRNLRHGHALPEEVDDGLLQRIVRALVGGNGLLLELAVAVARDFEVELPVLGLDRPVIGAITGIAGVEPNPVVLLVIQEGRQLRPQ